MKIRSDDKFVLKRFVVGPLAVNAYLLADPAAKDACIIDPGADAAPMKSFLIKNGLTLRFIINTHGHGDHIGANSSFNVPIYIHSLDKDFLGDPDKNLSKMFTRGIKSPAASRLLSDGDVIELGAIRMLVLHTPGHTPGSISLRLDGIVFTGDTLFNGGVGRTDLADGDEKALYDSINKKLMTLSDDTVIYPGHGEASTIGDERENNPFLT